MKIADDVRAVIQTWFSALPSFKHTAGLPARGSIAAALVVLEQLKDDYNLKIDAHLAPQKGQIRGLSPSAVQKILKRFGETRHFLTEGGRTNRGTPGAILSLLEALSPFELETLTPKSRNLVLKSCQQLLVEKVREYHERKRLEFDYDPSNSTQSSIRDLLASAKDVGKAGPVAQYLVGAKLQLRFPDISIANERFSAGDLQTGRAGDFQINSIAIHVTVAPMLQVMEKCLRNLRRGMRPLLLVPSGMVELTSSSAEAEAPKRIAVQSIETFIASNLEELATFDAEKLQGGFRLLLETYNCRVNEIELDKSLLIDVPGNLT